MIRTVFYVLRIMMAVLWGTNWRQERTEAMKWLWVVIIDQRRAVYDPNCVWLLGMEIRQTGLLTVRMGVGNE